MAAAMAAKEPPPQPTSARSQAHSADSPQAMEGENTTYIIEQKSASSQFESGLKWIEKANICAWNLIQLRLHTQLQIVKRNDPQFL